MDPTVGERVYAPQPQTFLAMPQDRYATASDVTAREIDVAVLAIIARAEHDASAILSERRADLDAGAVALIAKETLTADEFPPLRGAGRGQTP